MKRIWRYVRKSFLPAAVCSLALLTGCGSSETLAEPPQNKSGETIMETITEAITETPPTESPAGEDVTRSDYVTVVEITINPKVALYVAADGSVVKVEYLNEDARNAFSDLVLVGESLEDAVSRIVDTAVQEGYLTDGKMIP
ncbi:MAG: hypothetical protein J6C84_09110 [Lachnospiraceae bacterium]|nr:hypothetical protein [Lachnospiraceae bacterium]